MANKLASALNTLRPVDGAHQMTAAQLASLFNFDHAVLHAHGGSDHFTNLTPIFIGEHRAKTKVDIGKVAKAKRLSAEQEEHRRRMLQPAAKRKAQKKSRWPKRKIPSRPFSNKKRRLPRRSRQLPNA